MCVCVVMKNAKMSIVNFVILQVTHQAVVQELMTKHDAEVKSSTIESC